MRREIARRGWTIVGSAADGRRPAWMYTVGLLSRFDHPELIVVDFHDAPGEILLGLLALRVGGGESFSHDSVVDLGGFRHGFGWVHPRHFELDTFDLWEPLMQMHVDHFAPRALQVFPADEIGVDPVRRRPLSRPTAIR